MNRNTLRQTRRHLPIRRPHRPNTRRAADYAPDASRELIAADGNTARAEVRRRSPDKISHDGLAFVDDGTGRKIVNNVTRLEAV